MARPGSHYGKVASLECGGKPRHSKSSGDFRGCGKSPVYQPIERLLQASLSHLLGASRFRRAPVKRRGVRFTASRHPNREPSVCLRQFAGVNHESNALDKR